MAYARFADELPADSERIKSSVVQKMTSVSETLTHSTVRPVHSKDRQVRRVRNYQASSSLYARGGSVWGSQQ
jgi:hypothetical protein